MATNIQWEPHSRSKRLDVHDASKKGEIVSEDSFLNHIYRDISKVCFVYTHQIGRCVRLSFSGIKEHPSEIKYEMVCAGALVYDNMPTIPTHEAKCSEQWRCKRLWTAAERGKNPDKAAFIPDEGCTGIQRSSLTTGNKDTVCENIQGNVVRAPVVVPRHEHTAVSHTLSPLLLAILSLSSC